MGGGVDERQQALGSPTGAAGPVNGSAGFGPGPYGDNTYLGQHEISLGGSSDHQQGI